MKLKYSNSTKNIKRKRITFSAMLNSEYLFHRSSKIQMALNHNPLLSKDFHIKRAQSKINTGKKRKIINQEKKIELNSSEESNKEMEQKDVPLELYFIILEYQKKFLKENNKFFSIKEYNDAVLSFWHYLNETNDKKERDLLLKKYFPNNDYNTIINLYSDQIQKIALNLFKTNPLLIYKNYSEIFFHYLSEYKENIKDENKINTIKQKSIKFLNKLKDFLEYVKIEKDEDLDSISKDIKMKNSKYIKEFGMRIKNEMLKIREKRNLINNKNINESKKMIDETKNTLFALDENKNVFEDPKNFDPFYSCDFNKLKNNSSRNIYFNKIYKRNDISKINKIKFFSPNKTGRMTSTMSTGFYLSDKKKTIKKVGKKIKFTNEEDTFKSNENSLKDTNNILKFSHIKKPIKVLRRYSSSIIDLNMQNKLINSLKNKTISLLKNENNSGKNVLDDLATGRDSIYSSNENDDNQKDNKITESTSKLIKIMKKNKKVNFFTPIVINNKNLKKNSISISKTNYEGNNDNTDINIRNKSKEELLNIKKVFNYNRGKDPLLLLYNDIQKKNKIKKEDADKIKKYLKLKGKNTNLNFNPMDIIKETKLITNKLDIERKTKRVFQPYLSYKQLQKLDDVTKLNEKVHKLDIDYIKHIFDFKSRNSESIQAYI